MSTPLIIDRFIAHHGLNPRCRSLFVDRFGDEINSIDPARAWELLEQSIQERPHFKLPEPQKELSR